MRVSYSGAGPPTTVLPMFGPGLQAREWPTAPGCPPAANLPGHGGWYLAPASPTARAVKPVMSGLKSGRSFVGAAPPRNWGLRATGACPQDAPEPPSTVSDRHQQQPANMKLGRALNPRATHGNTLVMRRSFVVSRALKMPPAQIRNPCHQREVELGIQVVELHLHPSEAGTDVSSYLLPKIANAERPAPKDAD